MFSTTKSTESRSGYPQTDGSRVARTQLTNDLGNAETPTPEQGGRFLVRSRRQKGLRPNPTIATPQGGMTETTCQAGRGSCVIETCNLSYVESPALRPPTTSPPVDQEASDARQRRQHPEAVRGRPRRLHGLDKTGNRPPHRGVNRGAWHQPRGWCWAGKRTFSDFPECINPMRFLTRSPYAGEWVKNGTRP